MQIINFSVTMKNTMIKSNLNKKEVYFFALYVQRRKKFMWFQREHSHGSRSKKKADDIAFVYRKQQREQETIKHVNLQNSPLVMYSLQRHLLKNLKYSPSSTTQLGTQVFKYVSLWGAFFIQTIIYLLATSFSFFRLHKRRQTVTWDPHVPPFTNIS